MLYDTCYSYLVLFSNAVYTCFLSCALTHSSIVHVITFFGTLGTALTGTTGRAIGLVALAAVGIMFLFGRMNMAFAVSICVGLVILFGAATILGGFA